MNRTDRLASPSTTYVHSHALRVVLAGVLSALTILLGLFPFIGFIPVPTPAGYATTMHIPAILGGILGGPIVGALVGAFFGLFSFIRAPLPMFKDPLVAILPRIFIGVVAWAAWTGAVRARREALVALSVAAALIGAWFALQIIGQNALLAGAVMVVALVAGAAMAYLSWRGNRAAAAVAVAAIVGSLTNTGLVLGMAVFRSYFTGEAALLVGATHGIPEAVVAAIVAGAVVAAVRGTGGRERSSL